jgi:hypothetical protein
MPSTYSNLDELFAAIKSGETELTPDLPTFGGTNPDDTTWIWSWDETQWISGPCVDELVIEDRDDN